MIEHFLKRLGAGEGVLRGLLKKVEKFFFMRSEVKHPSRPFASSRLVINRGAKPLSMKCYGNITEMLQELSIEASS